MDWFKHYTASLDDPDIMDAMDEFGDKGYSIFFMTLEIYGREFNKSSNGELTLSKRNWTRKLRKRWAVVEKVWNFYATCGRFCVTFSRDKATIKIPKFLEISSNWTKRKKTKPTEAPTEAPTAKEVRSKKKNKETTIKTKAKKIFSLKEYKPEFISLEEWDDLLFSRKKKKCQNTEAALKPFVKQLKIAYDSGLTVQDCLDEYISGTWTRFKAEWMPELKNNIAKPSTYKQQQDQEANKIAGLLNAERDFNDSNKQSDVDGGQKRIAPRKLSLP